MQELNAAPRETCQPVTGRLPVNSTCLRQVTPGRPRTYRLPRPGLEAYRLRTYAKNGDVLAQEDLGHPVPGPTTRRWISVWPQEFHNETGELRTNADCKVKYLF